MNSSVETFTVVEFGAFSREVGYPGYVALPQRIFDELEEFILLNSSSQGVDAQNFFSLTVRAGVGKVITAKNYVGIVTLSRGTVIEVLPKIIGREADLFTTRTLFMNMLKSYAETHFRLSGTANINSARINIFEVFIELFIEEVFLLIRTGLSSEYVNVESNQKFYKGKLLTAPHIKHNLFRRDRFFVRNDLFSINRVENRLLKSALLLLYGVTSSQKNKQSLRTLLSNFENVTASKNVAQDFNAVVKNRSTHHYRIALAWSKLFLSGSSFAPFQGVHGSLALLFPMEQIFENFVAKEIRRLLPPELSTSVQNQKYSLFDEPQQRFFLRPDLVFTHHGQTIVADTKWKLLTNMSTNFGISQSDMYQMYAYAKKYSADHVLLIYPKSATDFEHPIWFTSEDGVKVSIIFVDFNFSNPLASLENFLSSWAHSISSQLTKNS